MLRVRRPAGARDRYAMIDYKTNWLGAGRRATVRLALPPAGVGARDAALALRAAGAALLGGAAPLPALAAGRLRPGERPGRGPLPVPARDARTRRPDSGVFAWRPPARWSRRSATCSPEVNDERDRGAARARRSVRAEVALRAPEPLAAFNRAEALLALDIHVALTLGRVAGVATRRCCAASRWPSPRTRQGHAFVELESGRCASVCAPAKELVGERRRRAAPLRLDGRGSTWTATGVRSAASRRRCSRATACAPTSATSPRSARRSATVPGARRS